MPQITAYEDAKATRKERQVPTGTAWRTNFIDPDPQNPATPQAFLVQGTPGRVIKPHFHDYDQYQVIVSGDGLMGKHQLTVNAVHYSRAHTPYGPILFGEGMGFLTLRAGLRAACSRARRLRRAASRWSPPGSLLLPRPAAVAAAAAAPRS